MDDKTQRTAKFDNIDRMLQRMVPDPDRPESFDVGDPAWYVAPLTEGPIESGVWSCEVGAWDETDYAVDEVMVMTAGRLRITDTDGTEHDLTAGDMFYLPKHWAGRWEVVEEMQKIYFIVP